jgi:hypothetical protein
MSTASEPSGGFLTRDARCSWQRIIEDPSSNWSRPIRRHEFDQGNKLEGRRNRTSNSGALYVCRRGKRGESSSTLRQRSKASMDGPARPRSMGSSRAGAVSTSVAPPRMRSLRANFLYVKSCASFFSLMLCKRRSELFASLPHKIDPLKAKHAGRYDRYPGPGLNADLRKHQREAWCFRFEASFPFNFRRAL